MNRIFLNERLVLTVITANALVIFLLSFKSLEFYLPLRLVDTFFTLFFVVEAMVKIRDHGTKTYFGNGWDRFDFVVVVLSLPSLLEYFVLFPDFSFVLIFRLVRVVRLFRFVRFVPDVQKLMRGLGRAARTSLFVIIALILYNFLLSVLTCYFFRDHSPHYFGDPLTSLYSIFRIFTIEGWHEIPDEIVRGKDQWFTFLVRGYFVVVVLTGGMIGFSIVNALFVDEMTQDNTNELEAKVDELNRKIDLLLAEKEDADAEQED